MKFSEYTVDVNKRINVENDNEIQVKELNENMNLLV